MLINLIFAYIVKFKALFTINQLQPHEKGLQLRAVGPAPTACVRTQTAFGVA